MLVGMALGAASPAAASPGRAGPASHRRHQWQAPKTAKLVKALTHAHTAAKRRKAIEALLGGLGVGVYAPNGKQVVGGFERGANGLYLYTWEIDYLADQLGRGELASLDQAATQLAYAGLTLRGAPITGESLATAIRKGMKRLARPRARKTPAGALAAAVEALGRAHHVNLAKQVPASKPALDPVQAELLAIDGLRSAIGGAAGASGSAARAARAGAAGTTLARAGGGCSGGFSGSIAYAKGVTSMIESGGKSGGAGIIKQEIQDGADGSVLAYSVGIEPVNAPLKGAFGSGGPGSATPMQFQVRVVMRDEFGSPGGDCGRLAGYKLPKQGGIPGVPVVWTRDAVGHLTYLGQTPSCSTLCTSTTDGDGVATLTFQPDDEYLPGAGPTVTEAGTTTATEFVDAAQHNILGTIAEALGFNKQAEIPWEISYHNPGGYRVEIPPMTVTWIEGEGEEEPTTVTGTYNFENEEVCDNGPRTEHPLKPREKQLGAGGSSAHIHALVSNSSGSYEQDATSSEGAPIPIDFEPVAPKDYGNGEDGAPRISGLWVFDSPTLKATIEAVPGAFIDAGPPSPPSQSLQLPVTQAKSCGNGLG
jgi:hypothetical protein